MSTTFMCWSKAYWIFWLSMSVFVILDLAILDCELRDTLFSYSIWFRRLFFVLGVLYLFGPFVWLGFFLLTI